MRPAAVGWVFLGAYCGVVALVLVFIAVRGGDMTGLLLVFPALPWPALGSRLFGPNWGLGIGTIAGLVFNALIAFYVGAAIGRRRARSAQARQGRSLRP